ncbi:MAG: FAD-dependent oxidoreductase [Candidatus Zambryskibacteria bacterium]|nr:FAD-dependent oxidoreductase [Candidatus Zambryskibacteria bacterium]
MIYDLIIIGGGPAGVSAGVYAARKKLKTLLITPEFGGQSTVSEGIENWIGTVKISGEELAKNLKSHLLAYSGQSLEVKEEGTQDIKKDDDVFVVITEKGEYQTKTILIATGSTRRKLDIPGAKEFDNKGLTYCASCDGPLFAGQDVVVVGGGNAAFESAAQLLAYCKSVTLLNRTDKFRADEITIAKLKQNPNFKIITNAVPTEIKGNGFVKSIVWQDKRTKENHEIETPGIFVEIGLIPTTFFAKNILELNEVGQIPVNPKNQQTKVSGIWAAGDCSDGLYHQNNIASGDAVKALEDIYIYLHTK